MIGGAAAGTLLLFGAEGILAESYLQTPEGRREKQRAQNEGSALYRQMREIVLRPGVFGGLMGLGRSIPPSIHPKMKRVTDPGQSRQ